MLSIQIPICLISTLPFVLKCFFSTKSYEYHHSQPWIYFFEKKFFITLYLSGNGCKTQNAPTHWKRFPNRYIILQKSRCLNIFSFIKTSTIHPYNSYCFYGVQNLVFGNNRLLLLYHLVEDITISSLNGEKFLQIFSQIASLIHY